MLKYLGLKYHAYFQMDANIHNMCMYREKANVAKYVFLSKRVAEQPAI